jgi:hypothetical protein
MFSFITSKLFLITAGVALTIGVAFYLYIQYANGRIDSLLAENAGYANAVAVQQQTIDTLNTSLEAVKLANANILALNNQAIERSDALTAALARIARTAKDAPDTVTAAINVLSDNRTRCLELASGAIPRPNETNELCSDLTKIPVASEIVR